MRRGGIDSRRSSMLISTAKHRGVDGIHGFLDLYPDEIEYSYHVSLVNKHFYSGSVIPISCSDLSFCMFSALLQYWVYQFGVSKHALKYIERSHVLLGHY